jgi:hypothetical protein
MTPFSKWKTIGYAAAIFVTGGISGGALGVYEARTHLFSQPRDSEIAMRMHERLQKRLGLTDDQMSKIDPIIDSTASELHAIRMDTMERMNKVFDDSYAKVAALLTPDQKAKLDEMDKERKAMMQQHPWQENHHHPGGPDGSPGGPGDHPGDHQGDHSGDHAGDHANHVPGGGPPDPNAGKVTPL